MFCIPSHNSEMTPARYSRSRTSLVRILSFVWHEKYSAWLGRIPLIFSLPEWCDTGEMAVAGDVLALVDEVVDDGEEIISRPGEWRLDLEGVWARGFLLKIASSSIGNGSGAVQSLSRTDVGRPVMTASMRSVEHMAHQTRYRISLDDSVTFLFSFRRLRPRVIAYRIAIPLMDHDLVLHVNYELFAKKELRTGLFGLSP